MIHTIRVYIVNICIDKQRIVTLRNVTWTHNDSQLLLSVFTPPTYKLPNAKPLKALHKVN